MGTPSNLKGNSKLSHAEKQPEVLNQADIQLPFTLLELGVFD